MSKRVARSSRELRKNAQQRLDQILRQSPAPLGPAPLCKIAEACAVREVVFRPLLTDGGIAAMRDGFRVYIHSSAEESSRLNEMYSAGQDERLSGRQRFTLAHEIAHTLFFSLRAGEMPESHFGSLKPAELDHLEAACNALANRILVSDAAKRKLIDNPAFPSAALITEHAEYLRVSVQTLIIALGTWTGRRGLVAVVDASGRIGIVAADSRTAHEIDVILQEREPTVADFVQDSRFVLCGGTEASVSWDKELAGERILTTRVASSVAYGSGRWIFGLNIGEVPFLPDRLGEDRFRT